MSYLAVLSFIWEYVFPAIKEVLTIMGSDVYSFIVDRVDDADVLDMPGLQKRTRVYAEAMNYIITEKQIPRDKVDGVGTVMVYFMIELAVLNLRRRK